MTDYSSRQEGQDNLGTYLPFLQSKLGKASWSGELETEVRMLTRLKSLKERRGQQRKGRGRRPATRMRIWEVVVSELLEIFL